jgi:LysR family transcriptional regulator, low CO2-responsive transcriptional regulator
LLPTTKVFASHLKLSATLFGYISASPSVETRQPIHSIQREERLRDESVTTSDFFWWKERDGWICISVASHHPWSTLPSVMAHILCEESRIVSEPGSALRDVIDATFARQKWSIKPLLTLADHEMIKQMVIKGVGATILSARSVPRELADGELVRLPLSHLDMRSQLLLLWRDEKQFSPAAHAFRNVLQRELHREQKK